MCVCECVCVHSVNVYVPACSVPGILYLPCRHLGCKGEQNRKPDLLQSAFSAGDRYQQVNMKCYQE